MSVGLGTLKPVLENLEEVEVWSSDYDAEWIRLEQKDPDLPDTDTIVIDRNQMQHLSKLIDRFLDR